MTTYMGPGLGSLVPVKCLSSLSVQPSTRMAVGGEGGLSGRRVYVDPPNRPALRTWSASINVADPNEVGTLFELESLRQSLWMISDAALVENIFTPAAATGWGGGWQADQGGAVQTVDGWAATSAMPRFTNTFSPLLPVVPGTPISMGVYARAAAGTPVTMRIDWMDLGADYNATPKAIAASRTWEDTAAPLDRMVLAATPPANVHVARLTILNATQFARPSATWTPVVHPWRPGGGAESVYLAPLSQDVILAWSDGRALSSYSYTVTEVSA